MYSGIKKVFPPILFGKGARSMGEKRTGGAGIFFLSFGITFAILMAAVTGILYWMLGKGEERRTETASSQPAEEVMGTPPGKEEALNLVFISCRKRTDAPFAYTLCRFDPAESKVILVPVPPETLVTVSAREDTFAGHYDYAGCANVVQAAESLLLSNFDRYVRVGQQGAENIIDALGGLEHTFETGYQTDRVSVPAGEHLLNGSLLYEIMNSPPEGEPPETWRLGLCGELLVDRLDETADDRMDFLMEVFWNNTDTDLSQFDYTTRRKAVTWFLKDEEKQVEIIPLSGEWNPEHTEFIPGETAVTQLREQFGPLDRDVSE